MIPSFDSGSYLPIATTDIVVAYNNVLTGKWRPKVCIPYAVTMVGKPPWLGKSPFVSMVKF